MKHKADAKQAALDTLHKGVADIMTSNGWKRALKFRQRFHNYSYLNTLLILAQRPNATLVAGYRTWQTSNRFVRKGEKGIAILAPLLVRDPDDRNQLNLVGLKTVYVFDLAQTDGEPIPQREGPSLLSTRQKSGPSSLGCTSASPCSAPAKASASSGTSSTNTPSASTDPPTSRSPFGQATVTLRPSRPSALRQDTCSCTPAARTATAPNSKPRSPPCWSVTPSASTPSRRSCNPSRPRSHASRWLCARSSCAPRRAGLLC